MVTLFLTYLSILLRQSYSLQLGQIPGKQTWNHDILLFNLVINNIVVRI